jgi:RNA polymerase sigma-70 factor (ECF subfamily)
MASGGLTATAAAEEMIPQHQFQELFDKYAGTVYLTALRVTGNAADAEDVLQTVFLRLWKHPTGVEAPVSHEAYFRRAATNAAIDVLRRRQWRSETPLEELIPRLATESPVLLKQRLRQALSRLDPEDAELFVLKYIEGLSGEELAEMFGIERPTVGSRLFRIRQSLRSLMEA